MNRSESNKLILKGRSRKIRDRMKVNNGKVIEIARAIVVPSSF
jgi:hypothetical protein